MTVDNEQETKKLIFDVTIVDSTFRVEAENRSQAVTLGLKRFREAHPRSNIPLSILRLKVSTHQVDTEKEVFDEAYTDFLKRQECQ